MNHLEIIEQAINLATANGGFKTAEDVAATFQHLQAHKQEVEALSKASLEQQKRIKELEDQIANSKTSQSKD